MSKKSSEAIGKILIDAIKESGLLPWQKPWTGIVPANYNSKKAYRGFNRVWLSYWSAVKGFTSPYWMTPKQALKAGGNIKGEKTTIVVYWMERFAGHGDGRNLTEDQKRELRKQGKQWMSPIYHRVLNLDQIKGIDLPVPTMAPVDPIEAAEAVFANMPNPPEYIEAAGDRCFYTPSLDTVTMCKKEQFHSVEAYYATKAHEYIHSTGHKSRLDREFVNECAPFGSTNYSKEELVAEIGAAMLCGEIGIDPIIDNSVAYLQSWIKNLEDAPMELVKACTKAQKAVEYILDDGKEMEATEAA
jgi:antirestriction protein ArdC